MEKILKFIKQNIVGFIIGLIVAGTGVYAATVITASEVTYSNSGSGLSSTNVKGAIDELYKIADSRSFKINTPGTVFASKKGVCIDRNNRLHCFKPNNYNVEKTHIQEVFSDITCTDYSTYLYCYSPDYKCTVATSGDVDCYDSSGHYKCLVTTGGSVICT